VLGSNLGDFTASTEIGPTVGATFRW